MFGVLAVGKQGLASPPVCSLAGREPERWVPCLQVWGVIGHLVNAFVSPPATQAANAAAAVRMARVLASVGLFRLPSVLCIAFPIARCSAWLLSSQSAPTLPALQAMLSPSPTMLTSPNLSAWSRSLSPAAQMQRRLSSSGLPSVLSPGIRGKLKGREPWNKAVRRA